MNKIKFGTFNVGQGGLGHLLKTENLDLLKASLFQPFQVTKSEAFGGFRDSKRRLRGEIHPYYRLVNVYHKSTGQYWKERNRRKKVLSLHCKGLTYPEIAEELGISAKTVYRDLYKIRPYYTRLINNRIRKFHEGSRLRLQEKMAGMNLLQQADFMIDQIKLHNAICTVRKYIRHKIKVIINMDDMTDGYPSIRPWPQSGPFPSTLPLNFEFVVRKDGHDESLGFWAVRKA